MGWITTKEAAGISKLSDSYIRKLLAKGEIRGKRFGPVWLVSKPSLQKYLASERKPGPKKPNQKSKKRLRNTQAITY